MDEARLSFELLLEPELVLGRGSESIICVVCQGSVAAVSFVSRVAKYHDVFFRRDSFLRPSGEVKEP